MGAVHRRAIRWAAPSRARSATSPSSGCSSGITADIDGMVHMSDLSWDEPASWRWPSSRRADRGHRPRCWTSMSRRSASASASSSSPKTRPPTRSSRVNKGDVVTCIVTAVQSNGIEVKVDDVLTGFIRRAELARDKGDQRPERFAVGEKVDAKVTGDRPRQPQAVADHQGQARSRRTSRRSPSSAPPTAALRWATSWVRRSVVATSSRTSKAWPGLCPGPAKGRALGTHLFEVQARPLASLGRPALLPA